MGAGETDELSELSGIPPGKMFFKIGEVAKITGVKPYVLRYWESEFPWLKPVKTSANQRMYRRQDLALILDIKRLRYQEQQTIRDVKDTIRQQKDGDRRSQRPAKPPAAERRPRARADAGDVARALAELRRSIQELMKACAD